MRDRLILALSAAGASLTWPFVLAVAASSFANQSVGIARDDIRDAATTALPLVAVSSAAVAAWLHSHRETRRCWWLLAGAAGGTAVGSFLLTFGQWGYLRVVDDVVWRRMLKGLGGWAVGSLWCLPVSVPAGALFGWTMLATAKGSGLLPAAAAGMERSVSRLFQLLAAHAAAGGVAALALRPWIPWR